MPLLPESAPKPVQPFNALRIRADFPILSQQVQGHPLVYLDNAATAQKPRSVIDAISHYYTDQNANVHRGVHHLSQVATDAYEASRRKIKQFIKAKSDVECLFVKGTTEGINLIAQTYGRQNIGPNDEVIVSEMEHHSNIVPWYMLCEEKGAKLRVIPINDEGELCMETYKSLFSERTKLVSVVHISNVLGTINPADELVKIAHDHGVPIHLDGAQAVPHQRVDMQKLDCDFYTFSGHKIFGPTGIGILYGKEHLLDAMPPYQGGGSMIQNVSFDKITYGILPNKFEAGTPHIAGAIGLGYAIDYLDGIDFSGAAVYEAELLEYAHGMLSQIPGLKFIGMAENKVGVLSFVIKDIHPHDVGTILDQDGVAVRAGHHCAQPIMKHFDIPAATRASFAFYNTQEDIDALVQGLHKVIRVF
ncbi:MAG: cysteine desulfurase, partial [Candidatus Latescibacteria bacterium]|nr:cysteine desulfurase [Candidatus Latescibacterota bacterium]